MTASFTTISFTTVLAGQKTRLRFMLVAGLLTGFLALAGPAAQAQMYNVSVDTSGLTPGDSYAVDLQLNSSNSVIPFSTVDVSNFIFNPAVAGPGPTGTPTYSSPTSATGTLGSTVHLDDSATPFADFTQNFNNGNSANTGGPASSLSFNVDGTNLSSNASGGGGPDQFVFDLYDNTTSANVPTTGPSGLELFTLQNNGGTYAPTDYTYTGLGGTQYATTFNALPATPELGAPITFGVLLGLFGLGLARGRQAKARSQPESHLPRENPNSGAGEALR